MTTNVIITGPTGAIGTALINQLIEQNIEVYAICRPGSNRINNLVKDSKVHIIEKDISNLLETHSMLPEKCSVFFHLGWSGTFGDIRNDMYIQTKNIQYTLDAVELARACGCNTFIGAGSQAEYGRYEGILNAQVPTFPENGYGMAKLCAGQMSRIKCKEYGIRHIWTRILSVYGPYDGEKTMVMSTIKKLLSGEKTSFTQGEQLWDYIYSKDAAGIFCALMNCGKDGKIYCVGSGQAKPLKDYIMSIRDMIDWKLDLGIGDIPYAEKQVMYLCADIRPIIEDTRYKCRYDFETGIKETITWYKGRTKYEEN